jgi:serine/threonine-protein kinase
MPLAPGDKLGPYEILGLIGKGGMGEVYKARDSRLGRDVAIKVLLQERVSDPERKRRFLQEARAASALNHPNIVTVYDISQDEGRDFLVMEYVRGKTLKEVIPDRSLPLREVSGYGSQAASALTAAHKAGIIHRDIKSANIMVTSEGQVKVLDFGLAKLTDPVSIAPENETLTLMALTTPGMIMGTVAYMSPEQTRGELLDARSDIFSLGCVLYEAATGRLPFQGRSALESMHAIATADPPTPSTLNPELSAEFDRVIRLAMAKDRDRRYASADELAAALDAMRGESVPARTPWRWAAAALAVVAVIGAAALLSPLMRRAADPSMIAVLPFVDLGNDPSQRYFSQGVTEDIIAQLGRSGSSGFGVINGPSIWRYRDAQPAPHQLAADLAAGYVVTGSIQHENNLLRIAARLTRTRDEVQVWAGSFDGPRDNLFALQRNVAVSVAKAVASQLALAAPRAPEQVERIDGETYNLYLLGRFYWNQRTEASLKGAVDYFKQVIGRAPGYAPAHAGLADTYAALVYGCYLAPAEGFPLARAELQRARELNPRSAEVSASEGYLQMYFDWDLKTARKSLEDAISLNPNYAPAYDWLGVLLTATQEFPPQAKGWREHVRWIQPHSRS